MHNNVMVSVVILAYNHEKYIRRCLESVINQKCSFKYEILVHDDVSSDLTREIITEYKDKHPDLIKVFFEEENVYSKGYDVLTYGVMYPKCNGKYIALCEGDDFWTDCNKLQMQYEAMERNPDCSFCANSEKCINPDGTVSETIIPYSGIKELLRHKMSGDSFIRQWIRDDVFFQTSSYFIRAKYIKNIKVQEFMKSKNYGDVPLVLWLALNGNVIYIDKIMSAYQLLSDNSYTKRYENDAEFKIKNIKQLISIYKKFNAYSGYKYDDFCKFRYIQLFDGINHARTNEENPLVSKEVSNTNKKRIKPYISFFVRWLSSRCSVVDRLYVKYQLRALNYGRVEEMIRNEI